MLTMFLVAGARVNSAAGFVHYRTPKPDFYHEYKTPPSTITTASPNRGARPLKVSLSAPNTAAFSNQNVGWDWISLAGTVFEEDQRPVILFDGVCNLCNGGVNFVLDHDVKGEYFDRHTDWLSTPSLFHSMLRISHFVSHNC